MKTFLLIGLDPYGIDFTAPNVPKGMTAEKLSAAVANAQKQFSAQGDRLDNCIIKIDGSGAAPVTAQLGSATSPRDGTRRSATSVHYSSRQHEKLGPVSLKPAAAH
jgi:hypothetical protein